MDKLIPVQGVDHPTFGGKKLHDRVNFPDFSAFQMTIAGGAAARHIADPGAREASVAGPAPNYRPNADPGLDPVAVAPDPVAVAGLVPVPADVAGPVTEAARGRLNAPPFSWLGSDAWPNFALWQDKPS